MSDRRARYAAAAGALTAAVVTIGILMAPVSSEQPRQPIEAPDIPLSELRLDEINATRTPFCRNIPDEAVTTAVGGSAQESEYTSGEREALEPGLEDVVAEFGCVFTRGTTIARVWVFAAPVTPYDARRMVTQERTNEDCTPTGVLQFGRPGTVLSCSTGGERVLRAVGRIGDAWVHCELSTSADAGEAQLALRGQRWCVAAVYAMQG